MQVPLYAKMLKETEETRLFVTFFLLMVFCLGEPSPLASPLATPMIATLMLFVILRICVLFACLPLCACQSYSNGSNLYDHAKYVILLVKIKIVLNSSSNLKL